MMNGNVPNYSPNSSLYPWSQRRLNFVSPQGNPFPRYGAAINAVASKEGDIYMMGGLIDGSTVKGDIWKIESGNLSCGPIATIAEGPGPRVGHASLLVGNAFIVFGGDTKVDENDTLDDTLYLLNICTYRSKFEYTFCLANPFFLSLPPMVACTTSHSSAHWTLRPYIEYTGLQALRVRGTGRRLLLQ